MKKKYFTEEAKKEAQRLNDLKYRENNRDILNERTKKWVKNNPEKRKEYVENNREKANSKSKEWAKSNPDRVKENGKKWRKNNPDYQKTPERKKESIERGEKWRESFPERERERHVKYRKNNPNHHNEYLKKRKKDDPLFKLTCNLRRMINMVFKIIGHNKPTNTHTEDVLGCTYNYFLTHIESQWLLPHNLNENGQTWMNWDNRGLYNGEFNYGWDIDHKIPLSSANTEIELLKLCHYTNLQPLCSKINRYIKKDNV